MDSNLLARLGLSRLRLPVPSAKFAVVHLMAEILNDPVYGEILWNELLDWLAGLELESEVIEALCIPVLAKHSEHVDVGALQRVIERPSPLSDIISVKFPVAPCWSPHGPNLIQMKCLLYSPLKKFLKNSSPEG